MNKTGCLYDVLIRSTNWFKASPGIREVRRCKHPGGVTEDLQKRCDEMYPLELGGFLRNTV
jgi:hypothetical protein